jgi:hypothetical protein
MPNRLRPRTVNLWLWLLLGVLSVLFGATDGLAYSDGGTPPRLSHARELYSSGSDDDVCIQIGVNFALLALVWGGLRRKVRHGVADLIVHALLLGLQMLYLMLIEVGSITETVVLDRNVVLALWMGAYGGLCALWVRGLVRTLGARRSSGGGARTD